LIKQLNELSRSKHWEALRKLQGLGNSSTPAPQLIRPYLLILITSWTLWTSEFVSLIYTTCSLGWVLDYDVLSIGTSIQQMLNKCPSESGWVV
jgi:hypothetical protein